MRSLTVVFPASMWAMMPMLRRLGRSSPGGPPLVELMTNLGDLGPCREPGRRHGSPRRAPGSRSRDPGGREKRVQDFAGNALPRQFGPPLLSRRAFPRGLGLIGVAIVMTVLLIVGLVVVALIQRPHRTASVVLVVLDTVRLDHLTPYGYAKETTPRLMQFAQEGLLFERARSAAPWTLSSHA